MRAFAAILTLALAFAAPVKEYNDFCEKQCVIPVESYDIGRNYKPFW